MIKKNTRAAFLILCLFAKTCKVTDASTTGASSGEDTIMGSYNEILNVINKAQNSKEKKIFVMGKMIKNALKLLNPGVKFRFLKVPQKNSLKTLLMYATEIAVKNNDTALLIEILRNLTSDEIKLLIFQKDKDDSSAHKIASTKNAKKIADFLSSQYEEASDQSFLKYILAEKSWSKTKKFISMLLCSFVCLVFVYFYFARTHKQ